MFILSYFTESRGQFALWKYYMEIKNLSYSASGCNRFNDIMKNVITTFILSYFTESREQFALWKYYMEIKDLSYNASRCNRFYDILKNVITAL